MYLEKIEKPSDVQKLKLKEKKILADEIREFLIDKVSKTGGHLASNLGVVEITIALLSCLDLDNDKVIFDVGHQSYVYKMLTGRKDEFDKLRKYKGLRGFPYRKESKYDFFDTGHSSTSISAALGMARARDIKKEDYNIVSVIGDGSISSGESLEAINDLGFNKTKMIIILNDNGMSISSNVGGISSYLSRISINTRYLKIKNKVKHSLDGTKFGSGPAKYLSRIKDGLRTFLVPSKYFETMGLTYIGPVDGHDIKLLTKVINQAKKLEKPIIIHAVTKKGNGYEHAMKNPDKYHGVSAFDKEKGVVNTEKVTYSTVFGKTMVEIAEKNDKLVAITAAMKDGVQLSEFFEKYPERSFDVGICEEHATTFSAGLSSEGMIPVFAVYSTFLQRGFDQLLHDVCMQNLPTVFALDRAGLVGSDGETHQGIFDLSYLSLMPNMVITSPKTMKDLPKLLKWAVKSKMVVAIRYPRGGDYIDLKEIKKVELGKWEEINDGEKVAIIATGKMVQKAYLANKEYKLNAKIINATFIKPLDEDILNELIKKKYNILTIEDNVLNGGLGSLISFYLLQHGFKGRIKSMGFDDKFIEQGTIEELYNQEGLTIEKIKDNVESLKKEG
ncbi:MAG: 1-deoxy-D-xylulose-5-phosphate synthase [Bacilli bacterium]|nr:1-deoxy-D-xylulose-5-phosphate synthase [Bacilli bacterium]